MADPASIFEQIDDNIEAQAIVEAEADVAAGRIHPHTKVKAWLERLAKGEFKPFSPESCE